MPDDFSELAALAADLTGAPDNVVRFAKKAVEFTAHAIDDDWTQGAERTGLEGYAASISYEMEYGPHEIAAEIGPVVGGQGSLGLVEDAGGGVRSAPQHAGRDALDANEPDFHRGLEVAIFDATTEAVKK